MNLVNNLKQGFTQSKYQNSGTRSFQRSVQHIQTHSVQGQNQISKTCHQILRKSSKFQVRSQAQDQSQRKPVPDMNSEQLSQAIKGRTKPIIIDFYATWCGPCKLLSEQLEIVADELGDKIQIIKINTDVETGLATELQIEGLPTVIFVPVQKSQPALRLEGLHPAKTIIDQVENMLEYEE